MFSKSSEKIKKKINKFSVKFHKKFSKSSQKIFKKYIGNEYWTPEPHDFLPDGEYGKTILWWFQSSHDWRPQIAHFGCEIFYN